MKETSAPPKKLLIVATTFYPDRMVAGIRVTEWARHLPEFGWKPIVLCRSYGPTATPAELSRDVHPAVELRYLGNHRAEAVSSAQTPWSQVRRHLKRGVARTLGQVAVPDVSIRFWQTVRDEVASVVEQEKPDAILTTSPPHSNHDIGMWMTRVRPDLPWVADFRDPYLIDGRYGPHGAGRLLLAAHQRYEHQIYTRAALVTHAIPIHARWARRRYPESRKKIRLLMNGCATASIEAEPAPFAEAPQILTMGANADQTRRAIGEAVTGLLSEYPSLHVRHVGKVNGVDEVLRRSLGDRYSCSGQVPPADVFAQLQRSSVLVAVLSNDARSGHGLSSKLFEFLVAGKPIIVINPCRGDRLFLRRYQGCRTLQRPTVRCIADALRWALSDEALPPASQVEEVKSRFSRKKQAEELSTWLSELVGGVTSPLVASAT